MAYLVRGLILSALIYLAVVGAVYHAMHQPPETFARRISGLPRVLLYDLLPFYRMWVSARRGPLRPGNPAPDFDVASVAPQGRARLTDFRGRPLLLLFGSYSSPALRGEVAEFNQMHRDYRDRVAILLIYLHEAHSVDGWQLQENVDDEVLVRDHASMDERLAAARQAIGLLKIEFPVAVDSFDNRTERAYTAWPARAYLINSEGRIARKGPPGPFALNSSRLEAILKRLLESKKAESPKEHARIGMP